MGPDACLIGRGQCERVDTNDTNGRQERRAQVEQCAEAYEAEVVRFCGLSKKALSRSPSIEVRPARRRA